MTSTVILIRHGTTAANLENRFAGRSAEPLHQQGITQINDVAERLSKENISGQIFAGPLPRTRQSAEIISRKLGLPVEIDDRLNEISIPHWDTLTKDEIRQKFGYEYPTWLATPQNFSLPGCETLEDVQERAVMALEDIITNFPFSTSLVISHLIVIRCLILYCLQLPTSEFRKIRIGNASLTTISLDVSGNLKVNFDQLNR